MLSGTFIVIREDGAELHLLTRDEVGFYLSRFFTGCDYNKVRRGYWGRDTLDAFPAYPVAVAEDIALTYEGEHSERVRYLAACLALGSPINPDADSDSDGGTRVDNPHPLPVTPPGGITLEALMN